jgi:hypothetical protein
MVQAFALREDEEKERLSKILTTDIVDFLDDADIPGTGHASLYSTVIVGLC